MMAEARSDSPRHTLRASPLPLILSTLVALLLPACDNVDRNACGDGNGDGCDDCSEGPDSRVEGSIDFDSDGFCLRGDCDDWEDDINPDALDVPANGIDENCDGSDASVVQMASGPTSSFAVLEDGTVWGWGASWYQADYTISYTSYLFSDIPVPRDYSYSQGVQDISVGGYHTLALMMDGSVQGDGGDIYGQDENFNQSSEGAEAEHIPAVAIAAGQEFSLALLEDGTVWAWGRNDEGQLGNGTRDDSGPVQIPSLADVIAIAAGHSHAMALHSDGTVHTWGRNTLGQLGDNTRIGSTVPVLAIGVDNAIQIAAGVSHSLSLTDDGSVLSWGSNAFGQLGDGSGSGQVQTVAMGIPALLNVTEVSAGANHAMALLNTGELFAWGANDSGQLGLGNTDATNSPEQVPYIPMMESLSSGNYHNAVLSDEGLIWTWGRNDQGQLGNGTNVNEDSPVALTLSSPY